MRRPLALAAFYTVADDATTWLVGLLRARRLEFELVDCASLDRLVEARAAKLLALSKVSKKMLPQVFISRRVRRDAHGGGATDSDGARRRAAGLRPSAADLAEDGRHCSASFAAAIAEAQPRFIGLLPRIVELVQAETGDGTATEPATAETFAQVFAACAEDASTLVRPRPQALV